MKWKNLALAASLLCGLVSHSQALTADQVKSFTLPNGMKFLVLESHTIPNANMYTYWKVGSRNEVPGITGLSHFFEHMMFNGSKKFGPKQFDRTMEAAGGANNAYTNNDLTVYQDWFPATALPVIFDLESDRIANLSIDPKMVDSERGVVLSERSTGLENSNLRSLWGAVYATAFHAHPYAIPTIGHESDIKAWTQADLENYFKTYYSPNNAVAVIVGAVKADEVKRLAEQYFAKAPQRALPPVVRTVEPEQKGERRVFVRKESATTPNLMVSYKVPATNNPDYYALQVLNSILTEGKTSRLYQALVDKRLATQVGADYGKAFDPGLFNFFAVAANQVPAAKVEAALLAEIDKLIREGVSEEEVQKVKNQKLLNFYRAQETINGKAAQIGDYEVYFGDYKKLFDAPEAYRRLRAADIQRVAATYFKKSQRTVGVLAASEE
ncbi:insulinase family protein [Undibacterium sp. CY7W]|uniref:Insulinase family protein n=2 Tax=Undibacterium rugosum TaxID=2762291 RepID=A0A923I0U5_9BURK|nr:insulinase family protein [Undibacterium rugosum]MBR7777606.1 insulinase family protein [Undibacterium rugosum]